MLYVSEFAVFGVDARAQSAGIPHAPALAEHALAIDAMPRQTEAFGSRTRFVMVHADEPCCLAFGTGAKQGIHRMAGDETRFYAVSVGSFISVIESE